MREHGVHEFFFRGLKIHCHHIALNEFGHFRADHVCAEELPGLLVEDHFDHTLVLAHGDRLAVADEREVTNADVELFLLAGLFGETDRGDLRRAIGAAGNEQLVHWMLMQPLDRLDADDAFVLGLVRKERRPGDVADGVNAGNVGFAGAIDDDHAALGFHAELFQAEILYIADHADRGNDPLDGERLRAAFAVVDGGGDAVALLVELGLLGAGQNLDALLLETFAREGGDLGVLGRQDLRQDFDDGHFGAERAIERGELDADGAGTDHEQRLRHAVGHHGFEIGPDEFLVGLDARQHAWPRAGGDDDVLCLIGAGAERALRRLAVAGLYGDFSWRVDDGFAPDHGDLVLPHQKADAVVEPLRYGARAFHDGGRIVGHFPGGEPVILGVLQVVEDFRGAEQRLGRDAAPVEADAAQIVTLHDRGFESELRGADGADIAARSRADDDDVEIRLSHSKPQGSGSHYMGGRGRPYSKLPNPEWAGKRHPHRAFRGRRSGCRKSSRAASVRQPRPRT